MSSYYTKVIPADSFHRLEEVQLQKAADLLLDRLWAMEVKINRSEAPVFIDCGGFLEEIRCPFCGADVFDFWVGEMNTKCAGAGFRDLTATLPCCGRKTTLDLLEYKAPCGFACDEIALLYPRKQPDEECIAQVEELLGTKVRVIQSRV